MKNNLKTLLAATALTAFAAVASAQDNNGAPATDLAAGAKNLETVKNAFGSFGAKLSALKDKVSTPTPPSSSASDANGTSTQNQAQSQNAAATGGASGGSAGPPTLNKVGDVTKGLLTNGAAAKTTQKMLKGDKAGAAVVAVDAAASAAQDGKPKETKLPSASEALDLFKKFKK